MSMAMESQGDWENSSKPLALGAHVYSGFASSGKSAGRFSCFVGAVPRERIWDIHDKSALVKE